VEQAKVMLQPFKLVKMGQIINKVIRLRMLVAVVSLLRFGLKIRFSGFQGKLTGNQNLI